MPSELLASPHSLILTLFLSVGQASLKHFLCVDQPGLKLIILLPLPPEYLHSRCYHGRVFDIVKCFSSELPWNLSTHHCIHMLYGSWFSYVELPLHSYCKSCLYVISINTLLSPNILLYSLTWSISQYKVHPIQEINYYINLKAHTQSPLICILSTMTNSKWDWPY